MRRPGGPSTSARIAQQTESTPIGGARIAGAAGRQGSSKGQVDRLSGPELAVEFGEGQQGHFVVDFPQIDNQGLCSGGAQPAGQTHGFAAESVVAQAPFTAAQDHQAAWLQLQLM